MSHLRLASAAVMAIAALSIPAPALARSAAGDAAQVDAWRSAHNLSALNMPPSDALTLTAHRIVGQQTWTAAGLRVQGLCACTTVDGAGVYRNVDASYRQLGGSVGARGWTLPGDVSIASALDDAPQAEAVLADPRAVAVSVARHGDLLTVAVEGHFAAPPTAPLMLSAATLPAVYGGAHFEMLLAAAADVRVQRFVGGRFVTDLDSTVEDALTADDDALTVQPVTLVARYGARYRITAAGESVQVRLTAMPRRLQRGSWKFNKNMTPALRKRFTGAVRAGSAAARRIAGRLDGLVNVGLGMESGFLVDSHGTTITLTRAHLQLPVAQRRALVYALVGQTLLANAFGGNDIDALRVALHKSAAWHACTRGRDGACLSVPSLFSDQMTYLADGHVSSAREFGLGSPRLMSARAFARLIGRIASYAPQRDRP